MESELSPWGTLTGVRPAKLMNQLINTLGEEGAKEKFINYYKVSPEKTELAFKVANNEKPIISLADMSNYSLYVSIPFCPSRCNYCSFVSHSITKESAKKLLEPYLVNLRKELAYTAKIAEDLDIKLLSIYIGGGTPSILSAEQIKELLSVISSEFDLSQLLEFTFEAGRPDTIDEEKLRVIKNSPVTRISINPQSFSDDVLEAIGRRHTAQDVIDAYHLAVKAGFDNINMDLIAGLPCDTPEKFEYSLKCIEELSPQCVTLHTLAQKRAADRQMEKSEIDSSDDIALMLEKAAISFDKQGYIPYYMYRQKSSKGSFENVGWAKPSFESEYNVFMMEECQNVFACGAGAVTKLKKPGENCIERIFNYKYPYEYISRFENITERKNKIYDFYKENK